MDCQAVREWKANKTPTKKQEEGTLNFNALGG
jgi:hypothetical protein